MKLHTFYLKPQISSYVIVELNQHFSNPSISLAIYISINWVEKLDTLLRSILLFCSLCTSKMFQYLGYTNYMLTVNQNNKERILWLLLF